MSAEVNNYDKVVGMLEKKFSSIREGIDEKYPNIAKEPERMNITGEEPTTVAQVRQSLSNKLSDLYAVKSNYSGKYAASQYMGKPITELMKEEKRTRKELEAVRAEYKKFESEHLQYYYNMAKKNIPNCNDERAENCAHDLFGKHIAGNYAENEREAAAHGEFLRLKREYNRCSVECNAVLTAKSAYMEDNADLIREVQEKRRRDDLLNSGLLDELGLAEEKAPEPQEKKPEKADEEPLEGEKTEEPGND